MNWLPETLRERLLLLCLLLIAGYGQVQTWSMVTSDWGWKPGEEDAGVGMDFYQFRWVPFVARNRGMQDFYTRENRMLISERSMVHVATSKLSSAEYSAAMSNERMYKGGMGASGTPFFYSLFGYFRTNNYDEDLKRFRVALLIVSELSILLFCAGLSYSLTRTVAMMALFSYWFKPFAGLLEVANVNHLQIGFICACAVIARMKGRYVGPALAGAVMGLALMFKPNPIFAAALFYLVFLARRDFIGFAAASVTTLMSAGAAFVLSSMYFGGTACWLSWITRTSGALKVGTDWNLSLAANIWIWTGVNTEFILLGGLMLLASFLILHPRRAVRSSGDSGAQAFDRTVMVLGLGLVIPLVAFRVTWEHHYTLAIPMILFALRPTPDRPNQRLRYVLAILAVALLFNLPDFFSMPRDGTTVVLMFISGGLILLYLGLTELARPAPQINSATNP